MKKKIIMCAFLGIIALAGFGATKSKLFAKDTAFNQTAGVAKQSGGSNAVMVKVSKDGKNDMYSLDNGETWITEAEYMSTHETFEVEWWTYDDFAKYVKEESEVYRELAKSHATGYNSVEGYIEWNEEYADKAIKLLEDELKLMKEGYRFSKDISEYSDESAEENAAYVEYKEEVKPDFSYEFETSYGEVVEMSAESKEKLAEDVKKYLNELLREKKIDSKEYNAILSGMR